MSTPREARSTPWTAWSVVVVMGGSSVAFNIVHAFRHSQHNWVLPALYGIGPVFAAVALSHIAADGRAGKSVRLAVVGVMLTAMAGSIGATASVVAPMAGPDLKWVYGIVMDAAALVALRVILDGRTWDESEETALEAAREQVKATRAQADARVREADEKTRAAQVQAATRGAEAAEAAARLEAEVARLRAELEAELRRAAARRPARPSARKPARNQGASSARKPVTSSAPEVPAEADLDTESQALIILAAEPGISGSQLGLRLGKSDRYGRDLIKRLAPSVPGPDES